MALVAYVITLTYESANDQFNELPLLLAQWSVRQKLNRVICVSVYAF